jgi:hypothetical protein
MAKHTRITIETESLLVMRGRKALRAWCPQCAAETEMIPVAGMEVVSNLAPAEVALWLGSEAIHTTQAPDGSTLLCFPSLVRQLPHTKPPGK